MYYILLCKIILIYDRVNIRNELLQLLFRYGRYVLCTVVLKRRRYTMIVTGGDNRGRETCAFRGDVDGSFNNNIPRDGGGKSVMVSKGWTTGGRKGGIFPLSSSQSYTNDVRELGRWRAGTRTYHVGKGEKRSLARKRVFPTDNWDPLSFTVRPSSSLPGIFFRGVFIRKQRA